MTGPTEDKKIEAWLRRRLFLHGKRPAKQSDDAIECQAILLRHISGTEGSELATYAVPSSQDQQDGIVSQLATQIGEEAAQYADGIGGLQKFMLVASYSDGSEERTVIRAGVVSTGEYDAESEPPTETGVARMLMEQNRVMFQRTIGTLSGIIAMQEKLQSRQAETIEKLTNHRWDSIELTEELMSRKHERDIASKREELKIRAFDDAYSKLAALLPIAVWKMTGKNLLGAPADLGGPESQTSLAMIDTLLESIDPAQFHKIAEGFNPQQQLLLGGLYEEYQRRKKLVHGDKKLPANGAAATTTVTVVDTKKQ